MRIGRNLADQRPCIGSQLRLELLVVEGPNRRHVNAKLGQYELAEAACIAVAVLDEDDVIAGLQARQQR